MGDDNTPPVQEGTAVIERGGILYVSRAEAAERLTAALGRGWSIRQIDRRIDAGHLTSRKFDDLQWVWIPEAEVKKLEQSRPRVVDTTRRRKTRTRATT